MSVLDNPNASVLLDMTFSELDGVDCNYSDPGKIAEIRWIVESASFICKHNSDSGVYDFILNLAMLERYFEESDVPQHVAKQLIEIRESGYGYILFNQGC